MACAGAILLLSALLVPFAVYTERPSFCPACHEMRPYYNAWKVGRHSPTSCVDCHVDPGLTAHALHKFVALKEVWDHFTRKNVFPTYSVDLPDDRCRRCHRSVETTSSVSFSHAFHQRQAPCKACHPTAGHDVSFTALADAGVLARNATGAPVPAGMRPSAIPGHVAIPCTRCHDQRSLACSACHKAPHAPRGECSRCHHVGEKFVFTHPDDPACAACHKAPANHFGPDCSRCHAPSIPFAKTVFRHPPAGEHGYRSFPCAKCHPAGYGSVSCTCHGGGIFRDD